MSLNYNLLETILQYLNIYYLLSCDMLHDSPVIQLQVDHMMTRVYHRCSTSWCMTML